MKEHNVFAGIFIAIFGIMFIVFVYAVIMCVKHAQEPAFWPTRYELEGQQILKNIYWGQMNYLNKYYRFWDSCGDTASNHNPNAFKEIGVKVDDAPYAFTIELQPGGCFIATAIPVPELWPVRDTTSSGLYPYKFTIDERGRLLRPYHYFYIK